MSFTEKYTKAFRTLLPTPFTIAVVLTIVTYLLSLSFGNKLPDENIVIQESVEETLLISNSDNTVWKYFNSGTLTSKLPVPIDEEADIKLLIDLKNLEENLIAIEIDKNNKRETIIM